MYLLILLIIVLGVSFAILNQSVVSVNYYLGQASLPLSLLIVLVFAIGSFFGLLVSFWFIVKIKIKNYRLKQRLKVAEKEVQNLRVIPIQDRKT